MDILDPGQPVIIYTDASRISWASVLCNQIQTQTKVCHFASGKFQDAQINYPSVHKELLAIKKSIESFQIFLVGHPFIVFTYLNNAMTFLSTKNSEKIGNDGLLRWSLWFSHSDVPYQECTRKT